MDSVITMHIVALEACIGKRVLQVSLTEEDNPHRGL